MKRIAPVALTLLLGAPCLTARAAPDAKPNVTQGGVALDPSARPDPRAMPLVEDVTSPRQPYAFFPLGGGVGDDLYLQNFVDLDASSPGILDWSGGASTFDGSTGDDALLPSFAEEDIGVPVFAALDGTVSQASYADRADHVTAGGSGLGDFVQLDHGAGQQTGYFSLAYDADGNDSRYAPVQAGQRVRAGTQIGLAASSGVSTGPHLHFQSSLSGAIFEPFAGPARPGPSWWVAQPVPRSGPYVEQYSVDGGNVPAPDLTSALPRQGTFVSGATATGCWALLHNLPANSTFGLRWLRPDGSVYHSDSGPLTFAGSGAFQRTVRYSWNYSWNPGLDQTGTWHFELSLNGQVVQLAPFRVVADASGATARPPYAVTVTLDPAQPTASDAIFCRVATAPGQDGAPLTADPDSSLVHYRYQWYSVSPGPGAVNQLRDVVSAGHADAIPWGMVPVGSTVMCIVTPINSQGVSGQRTYPSATVASRTPVQVAVGPDNNARLLWDTPANLTSLWRVDAAGTHTYRTYGPFAGYAPAALAVGPDNLPHVIFNGTDGTLSLWSVNAVGDFAFQNYGPFAGWTARSLAVDSNNYVHIMWTNTNGQMSLWLVNPDGSYNHLEYGPYPGYTARSLALSPNGPPHVLWTKTDGSISLWSVGGRSVNGDNGFTFQNYGPFSGWSAVSLAVGGDNVPHILWDKTDGQMSLWNVAADGSYAHAEYGPYPGWTAGGLGTGANDHPRVIWTSTDGTASLWDVDTSGGFTFTNYGL